MRPASSTQQGAPAHGVFDTPHVTVQQHKQMHHICAQPSQNGGWPALAVLAVLVTGLLLAVQHLSVLLSRLSVPACLMWVCTWWCVPQQLHAAVCWTGVTNDCVIITAQVHCAAQHVVCLAAAKQCGMPNLMHLCNIEQMGMPFMYSCKVLSGPVYFTKL